MFLISLVLVIPVVFFAANQSLPPDAAAWLRQVLPGDQAPFGDGFSL